MSALRTVSRLAALTALVLAGAIQDARTEPAKVPKGPFQPCKNHYILDDCRPVPGSAHWAPTGKLSVPREWHTANLLPNGNVLIAGGRTGNALLSSAELYDPTTNTWRTTGALSAPRAGHTATLLSDGRVLVTGGSTSNDAPSLDLAQTAEVYDPVTGAWSPAGRMSAIRFGHTATLLQNGTVLMAGGSDNSDPVHILRSAELYDPATATFNATGSLAVARYWHTATLLQDGMVLVTRGSRHDDLLSTLSDAELYDPVTGAWSPAGRLAKGSVFHTATLLPSGKVLVAGGYGGGEGGGPTLAVSELFDPTSRTWIRAPDLRAARYGHTAALLADGRVLLAGGQVTRGGYPTLEYKTIGAGEAFDVNTEMWVDGGSLNAARGFHTATLLRDGRVLVAGGIDVEWPDYAGITLMSAEYYGGVAAPPAPISP